MRDLPPTRPRQHPTRRAVARTLLAIGTWALLNAFLAAQPPARTAERAAGRAREEEARERWQKVPDILAALGARSGAHVADVGAGDGFFSTRLARVVGPEGKVYAVDIRRASLDRLTATLADDKIGNVEVIHSEPADPKLAEASIDAALIINAYHEMTEHASMLRHLHRALKPDGRLVIVEPIAQAYRGKTRAEQEKRHEIEATHVQRDLEAAGFRVVSLIDPFADRPDDDDVEWLIVAVPVSSPAG
jgi:predicted methyltransferase